MLDYVQGGATNQQSPFHIPRSQNPYRVVSLEESLKSREVFVDDLMALPLSRAIQEKCYCHQSRFIVINGGIDLSYDSQRLACKRQKKKYRELTQEEVAVLLHLKGMPQPNSFIPTASGLVFHRHFKEIFPSNHNYRLNEIVIHGKKRAGVIVDDHVFATIAACADFYKVKPAIVYCLIKRHGYVLAKTRFVKQPPMPVAPAIHQ